MMKLAVFTLLVAMIGLNEAKMQNVTVKGVAVCNMMRIPNIVVELWEKDTLDPNDLLFKTHTDKRGEFILRGGDNEATSIAPYVVIKHSCKVSTDKPDKVCTRKTEYIIPKNFIYEAGKAVLTYDMNPVNLDIFTPGEKEHCEKKKN